MQKEMCVWVQLTAFVSVHEYVFDVKGWICLFVSVCIDVSVLR